MPVPDKHWETPRLLARPPAACDAQAVYDGYASDPDVARYMSWRPHESVEETKAVLDRFERRWDDGSGYPWTLWHKEQGAFVGFLEIRVDSTAVDLGYGLARRWWRHGLMTEAVSAVVDWALAQPPIFRVWATCHVDNEASARLLERVGMTREGVLRRWLVHPNLSDVPQDCFCYSIVKEG